MNDIRYLLDENVDPLLWSASDADEYRDLLIYLPLS